MSKVRSQISLDVEIHRKLKDYCKRNGFAMIKKLDIIVIEFLNKEGKK